MTIAAFSDHGPEVRRCFRQLRKLSEEHAGSHGGLDVLSMGMSGDYEIAIEEGSTMARVGTAVFGPRPQ